MREWGKRRHKWKNMKPSCFHRNHLLTLMKPQGNWNCSNNAFIFDPHATHITNSNDHGIADTFPDTLYDIHRVDSVSSRWKYLWNNIFTTFPGAAAMKCMVFWEYIKEKYKQVQWLLKVIFECLAFHRDLRVLISCHTYFYEIWTIKHTLPAERASLEGKFIMTV